MEKSERRSPPFFEKDTEHRINMVSVSATVLGRLIEANDFQVGYHAETLSTVSTFYNQIVIR